MREALRVGVSGLGSIGRRHARLLAGLGVREVCLYDVVPDERELPVELAPLASWAHSFDELLDRDLDGLVVAVPDESHAEQVAAACRKGTPVLVEKPLAPSVAAGRQIEQVVAETGTPVLVGYVLRHCAPMRLAHKVLCEAGIGQLVSVHATLGAYETLRLSRNRFATPAAYRILFDYSHEWDYLEWLVAPIRRVAAIAHTSGDLPLLEDPNVVDGVLEFEGNPIGTFHLDYVQDNGGRSCTFVGDRGSLHLDAGRGTVDVRSAGRRAVRSYDCAEPRDAMFTRQLEHFLAIVQRIDAPCVTVADGIRAVAVAEAVMAACVGRTWVDVTR